CTSVVDCPCRREPVVSSHVRAATVRQRANGARRTKRGEQECAVLPAKRGILRSAAGKRISAESSPSRVGGADRATTAPNSIGQRFGGALARGARADLDWGRLLAAALSGNPSSCPTSPCSPQTPSSRWIARRIADAGLIPLTIVQRSFRSSPSTS